MLICFVNMPVEYYSPISGGAVSTVTAGLAKALESLGHDVVVLTHVDRHPVHSHGHVVSLGSMPQLTRSERVLDRFSRRLLSRSFYGYEQYRRAVKRALKRLPAEPDVVITHNDLAMDAVLERVLPNSRRAAWLHNQPAPIDKRRATRLDLVIAVSDHIRVAAIDAGAPPPAVFTVENGVDLDEFHDAERTWETPRVLCIGRLDPNKGIHIALESVAAAQRAGLQVHATLAGAVWWYGDQTSPYAESLMKQLADVGGQYVGLVSRPDIPRLYQSHDIVFALSLSEDPYPLVIHEAMASGCAVIGSRRGGIPQACGDAGSLVEPTQQQAADAALADLLSDRDALRAAQQASLTRVTSCSWSLRAETLQTHQSATSTSSGQQT